MGDPSLRLHPFIPISGLNLSTVNSNKNVVLRWNKSSDLSIVGYYIYSSRSLDMPFKLIKNISSLDSSYTDSTPVNGNNIYLVRAVRKEQTPSGTYLNMALGTIDSISAINTSDLNIRKQSLTIMLFPNPSNGLVKVFVDEQIMGSLNIECYDFAGRLILHKNTPSNNTELDFSSFAKGLYVIKMKNGTQESIKKLILE
jgi:hypothetical protein